MAAPSAAAAAAAAPSASDAEGPALGLIAKVAQGRSFAFDTQPRFEEVVSQKIASLLHVFCVGFVQLEIWREELQEETPPGPLFVTVSKKYLHHLVTGTVSDEGAQADTLPQDTVECTNRRPALLLYNVIAVLLSKLEYCLQARAS